MKKKLDASNANEKLADGALTRTSGYAFYNTSKFDFAKLLADPDNIADNFDDYLKGFSSNVADIIENFEFSKTVDTMVKGGVLFVMIQEFNSSKANMSPDKITSADMGYIFEELIRKFSESYDEQAGAHFTSRDIIYLMTELLIAPEKDEIKENGCTKTAYDMAMGTSQMLGCLSERLADISEDADLTCFGQEFNPETYAIAKSDMLIKGGNASGMMYGDTLSQDKFTGYEFDYIISNPPFGIDWKREKAEVEAEAKKGFEGRFGPGLPAISREWGAAFSIFTPPQATCACSQPPVPFMTKRQSFAVFAVSHSSSFRHAAFFFGSFPEPSSALRQISCPTRRFSRPESRSAAGSCGRRRQRCRRWAKTSSSVISGRRSSENARFFRFFPRTVPLLSHSDTQRESWNTQIPDRPSPVNWISPLSRATSPPSASRRTVPLLRIPFKADRRCPAARTGHSPGKKGAAVR